MSLRISEGAFLALALGLAACSQQPAAQGQRAESDAGNTIACRVGGAGEFAEVCLVERALTDGNLSLVVRHPDGAFRRFDVLKDGRGLAVADGSQQAVSRFENGIAELAVGTDAYRFPVTMGQTSGTPSAAVR